MGLFKTRQNKKFNYEPRYYQSEQEGSPFHIERKFDKFRKATGANLSFKQKWITAWDDLKSNSNKSTNKTIILLILLFVLIFLFMIDFDFSIFKQPF